MLKHPKDIYKPLIIPILLFIISTLLVTRWYDQLLSFNNPPEFKASLNFLQFTPYILFTGCLLLALRSNSRQFLFSIILALFCYYIISSQNLQKIQDQEFSSYYLNLLLIIIPLNLIFFSTKKRPITSINTIFIGIIISFEISIILFLAKFVQIVKSETFINFTYYSPNMAKVISTISKNIIGHLVPDSLFQGYYISNLGIATLIISLIFISLKYLFDFKHLYIGNKLLIIYLFSAIFLHNFQHAAMIFFSFCAFSFIILSMESSFSLAYLDDLTKLPGKKKLEKAMQNLEKNYTIAMVGVDLVKQTNNKYGYRVGDQALQKISTELQEIGGGSKAFRFAGDKFTVIFPGKNATEAVQYLEKFRASLCISTFIVRNKMRKKASISDRKKQRNKNEKTIRLSVSIGVANKDKQNNVPEKVLKKADMLLYESKKAGRNRITK